MDAEAFRHDLGCHAWGRQAQCPSRELMALGAENPSGVALIEARTQEDALRVMLEGIEALTNGYRMGALSGRPSTSPPFISRFCWFRLNCAPKDDGNMLFHSAKLSSLWIMAAHMSIG
jgi:hypothetical protein